MCGHRLHGRTISTSGSSACTLSAIEHSVIITTRLGCLLRTQLIMCAVEPVKSASASTVRAVCRLDQPNDIIYISINYTNTTKDHTVGVQNTDATTYTKTKHFHNSL